jgi:hypothetical protein
MDFKKYYFTEKEIEEGIGDAIKDIGGASVGTVAKAVGKGVGRSIANVARGALGRTKTIAFEPNWLKVLKPIDQKTYQSTFQKYADWKSQKTKIGPKKKIEIKDLRDGVLGDFSGDKFLDILSKYDSSMQNVNMEAEIKPKMSIYLLNNGGKVIFMNLPVDEDGKKRKFAMGLDNKAERIFRLIHGMTFEDYSLKGDEEDKTKDENGRETLKYKFQISDKDYDEIAPEHGAIFKKERFPLNLVASNQSFSLFDLFNEEVIQEENKHVYKDKDGNWWSAQGIYNYTQNGFNPKNKYIAITGKKTKDKKAAKKIVKSAKKTLKNKLKLNFKFFK